MSIAQQNEIDKLRHRVVGLEEVVHNLHKRMDQYEGKKEEKRGPGRPPKQS